MQERGIQSTPVRNCDAMVNDDTEKTAKNHNSACKKGGNYISAPALGTWHWLEHGEAVIGILFWLTPQTVILNI